MCKKCDEKKAAAAAAACEPTKVVVCPTKCEPAKYVHRKVIEPKKQRVIFIDHVYPQIERITSFQQILHKPAICYRTEGCGYVCGTAC
jgi:hypothetical protein